MAGDDTCCQKVVRFEECICATGTAWGLFKGKSTEFLIGYWILRHAIYFGAAISLWLFVPESAMPIIIFFVVVHVYKLGRFLIAESIKEREQQKQEPAKMDEDGNFV